MAKWLLINLLVVGLLVLVVESFFYGLRTISDDGPSVSVEHQSLNPEKHFDGMYRTVKRLGYRLLCLWGGGGQSPNPSQPVGLFPARSSDNELWCSRLGAQPRSGSDRNVLFKKGIEECLARKKIVALPLRPPERFVSFAIHPSVEPHLNAEGYTYFAKQLQEALAARGLLGE